MELKHLNTKGRKVDPAEVQQADQALRAYLRSRRAPQAEDDLPELLDLPEGDEDVVAEIRPKS